MRRVGVLLANEPSTPRRQQRLGKVFEPIFEPEVAHCRLCDTLMSGIYAGAGGLRTLMSEKNRLLGGERVSRRNWLIMSRP